jgi:hypothetical protein
MTYLIGAADSFDFPRLGRQVKQKNMSWSQSHDQAMDCRNIRLSEICHRWPGPRERRPRRSYWLLEVVWAVALGELWGSD